VKREHAKDAADPVIRQAAGKKGAMAAVVLDHEQAHKKAGSRNSDQQRSPGMAERNAYQAAAHNTISGKAVIASSAMLRSRLGVL
jgi:hypothetical protein